MASSRAVSSPRARAGRSGAAASPTIPRVKTPPGQKPALKSGQKPGQKKRAADVAGRRRAPAKPVRPAASARVTGRGGSGGRGSSGGRGRGPGSNGRRPPRPRGGSRRLSRTTIAVLVVVGLMVTGIGGLTAAYFWAASGITSSMLAQPPAPLSTLDLYTPEQRANAETIIDVASAQGLGDDAATIGVMTAMGESGLRAINYGDLVGPDSRGLFQQRDNGHWGSLEQRMDPVHASTMFFRDLQKVPGWQALRPTEAAHAVQRNADSEHYTKFYGPARALVVAILDERAGRSTPTPTILPTEAPVS
ncbi:hypothetical protein [Okibacterium fritillariae]|nr:hypothetical protein [Okibacterium fritillariae]